MDLLPPESCYYAALLDDDEIIHPELDASPPDNNLGSRRPALRGWSGVRSDLADIKDILQYLISATVHSTDPPQLMPRPETSQERWKRLNVKKRAAEVYAQLGLGI